MPRKRWFARDKVPLDAAVADSQCVIRDALKISKRPLIAFSGGKDSISVALLCREQGIRKAICDASFYFPTMVEDVERLAKEIDLDIEIRAPQTNQIFREHPDFIFNPKQLNKAYHMFHRKVIRDYSAEGKFDCVFFGRRLDENFVGDQLIKLKSGIWQCYPLKIWSTVQTLNFLHRRKITLPRLYRTQMGGDYRFVAWYTIERDEITPEPFEAIYKVDPATVREVAAFNEEARSTIEKHEGATIGCQ